MSKGTLFLIPVPLAENTIEKVISNFQFDLINNINTYIVENEKTARFWLKQMGLKTRQSDLTIHVYGKHSKEEDISNYFKELEEGWDVGLMSEAGCPAIADPGSEIVLEAHRRSLRVVPMVGPSSIILALMASGFNGQNFAFHGYLPIDKAQRVRRIKDLETAAEKLKQTQIFIETPFRNNQLLEDIIKTCNPKTKLCVACNISSDDEQIISKPIEQWRKQKPDFHKKPAIFLIHK